METTYLVTMRNDLAAHIKSVDGKDLTHLGTSLDMSYFTIPIDKFQERFNEWFIGRESGEMKVVYATKENLEKIAKVLN